MLTRLHRRFVLRSNLAASSLVEALEARQMLSAPTLVGSNHLNAIAENDTQNPGTRVAALVAGLIADADGPAAGIAVVAADTAHGQWQYALDGTTWADLGPVSNASALRLSADLDTRVRFLPALDFNGTVGVGLTFRAWDASDAAAEGSTGSALATGGDTALSSQEASAGIVVDPVGVAPSFTAGPGVLHVDEDSAAQSIPGFVSAFTPGSANDPIPKVSTALGLLGNGYPAPISTSGLSVSVTDVAQIPNSVDPVNSASKPARLNYAFAPNDGSGRLFVNDMRGKLWIIQNGTLVATPFLDIAAARAGHFDDDTQAINSERGFSTFAFSPDFNRPETPGYHKLYTVHTEFAGTAAADFGLPWTIPNQDPHQDVLSEWTVSEADPNLVDPASRREILRLDQPRVDHNMNQIAFNPAAAPGDADYGKLYIGVGDGGNTGNDTPFIADRFGDAQNPAIPFGKILRIDPFGTTSENGQYSVPADNPFVGAADPGDATLDEVWALGLRNPQRFSWDPVTGKMLIADLGQKSAEEINLGAPGANYGWGQREGMFVVDHNPGEQSTVYYRPADDAQHDYAYPVATYDRSEGIAVVGGFVYRGSAIPYLQGKYVFGDLNNGKLFYVDVDDMVQGAQANIQRLTLTAGGVPTTLQQIIGISAGSRVDLRFGLGADGEIYLTTKADGKVRRLGAEVQPATLTPAGPLPSAPHVGLIASNAATYEVSDVSDPSLFSVGPAVAPDGTLTFTPAANAHGSVTFTLTARDTGGTAFERVDTSAPQTFTIEIDSVNDAPVLDGQPVALDPIFENQAGNLGTTVAALLAGHVTDIDEGALRGLAITAADNTHGQWEYTLDAGENWSPIGAPSESAALLLPDAPGARVRFVPAPGFTGEVAPGLTYRAWDQTAGLPGGLLDATVNGGTASVGEATSTASINVKPVPAVTAVLVRGTGWTTSFVEYLSAHGLGSAEGYALPVGDGGQLAPLPWVNLNQVTLRFSEPVTIAQDDLILRGVNTAAYSVSGFTTGADAEGNFIATWTLASAIGVDKLLLNLSDSVIDTGGTALDGEWVNPLTPTQASPSSLFPSGDGTPGGAFTFRFNVAPGDVNQNGGTNVQDVVLVRNRQASSTVNDANYSPRHDVNGNGGINVQDVVLTRNQQGKSLPAGEPALPAGASGLFLAAQSALVVQGAPPSAPTVAYHAPAWPASWGAIAGGWKLSPAGGSTTDGHVEDDDAPLLKRGAIRRLVQVAHA